MALPPLPEGYTLDAPAQDIPSLPEGYTLDQQPQQPVAQQPDTTEKGFIQNVLDDFSKRGEDLGKNLFIAHDELLKAGFNPVDAYQAVQKIKRRSMGGFAGGIADIVGEGVISTAKTVGEAIPEAVKDPVKNAALNLVATEYGQDAVNAIQGGVESYNEFKKENPQTAQDIEDVVNIASLLPIGKAVSGTAKLLERGVGAARKGAIKTGQELSTFVPQTTKNLEAVNLLKEKSLSPDIAKLKVKPKTTTEKLLGLDIPKAVTDKIAKQAIKQGFDPAVIQSVKLGSKTDKKAMKDMVRIVEKAKNNAEYGLKNRPTDVVGDSLLKRFRVVKNANKRAGENIDKVVNSIKNKPFDAPKIEQGFVESLNKMDIKIGRDKSGKIKLDFKGSDIQDIEPLKKSITDVVKRMSESPYPTTGQAHKLKKYLDEKISYDKVNSGLQGKTEKVLKDLRVSINNELKDKNPRYAKINKIYAETVDALDELQGVAGKKTDILGEGGASMIGQKLRGIMSNNTSRVQLINAYKNIEKLAKKYGGKFDSNIEKQVLFADELDKVFKPAGRTSFQGQIRQALEGAVTPKSTLINKALEGAEKLRGINDKGAIKAIRQLLNE